jgi:alkylated DNA repair dioxygenase AlkB
MSENQCTAITKKGSQCKNKSIKDSQNCRIHSSISISDQLISSHSILSSSSKKIIYDSNQIIQEFDKDLNASYFPQFLETLLINSCLIKLSQVPFCQVTYHKYGKVVKTPRQTCCYGQYNDQSTAKYRGREFQTITIPDWLVELKEKIEHVTNRKYNAVILNKYIDGHQHISWHADSESFLEHHMIASLTFGHSRDFQFRKSSQDKIREISMKSGSLLVFDEGLLHCLPKRTNQYGIRYNITFRCVKNSLGIGNYYYYNRGQIPF